MRSGTSRRREAPRQLPGSAIRDALTKGSYSGNVIGIFLTLRSSAMRRRVGGWTQKSTIWTADGVFATSQ